MYIWDMNTGYIVTSCIINPCPCLDIAWGGRIRDIKKRPTTDYLFGTCGVNEIRIWSMTPSTGKLISEKCKTLNLHRTFTCLTFGPSGMLLLAGTASGDWLIFDVRKLCAITNYETGTAGGISAIACISMVKPEIHDTLNAYFFLRIYVSSGNGSISYWEYNEDMQRFFQFNKYSVDGGKITCMDISSAHNELLIGTEKGVVFKCDRDLKSFAVETYNETASIIDVQFPSVKNGGSHQFITVSEYGAIRRWNSNNYSIELSHSASASVAKNNTNNNIIQHGNNCGNSADSLRAKCFDFSDEIIIVGWSDGHIQTYNYNISEEKLWSIPDAHRNGVTCIKLSLDDKHIVSGGANGELRVWDTRYRKLVLHMKEHSSMVTKLALFEDRQHVLSCSRDHSILCWDLAVGKSCASYMHKGNINDIVLCDKEQTMISVGGNCDITFWDMRQKTAVFAVKNAHDAEATCIKISNDGQMLVSGGNDNYIKIWDVRKLNCCELMTAQKGCSGRINSLSFSTDDKQIVSVGSDASIMIWNVYHHSMQK